MTEQGPTKEELAEQVRRLEEKLREMGAQAGAPAEPAPGGGLAEGLVAALGRVVPGLQTLMDVAAKMPEFHERLAAIDEEVKRKFRDQPLRQASAGVTATLGRRKFGIPPGVRRARSGGGGGAGAGGAATGHGGGAKATRGKHTGHKGSSIHITPQTPAQLPVDVFDEGGYLAVLADAPGLQLKDFALALDGTVLVITIDAPDHKGTQRVELPCPVSGPPTATLAKGVLNIHLKKAGAK